jgi:hypothetical protein
VGGGLRSAVGRRPGDPLGPEDLERLATAAYLIGRDADSDELLTRAHHGFLRQGEVERAARCAFWLGFLLLLRAEPARSGGWLARARGLLDDGLRDCVEQGLLLVLVARQHLSEGDAATACATSDKATTAERELLPVAEAFGLSVCGWAPMGAGILTGKYTAGGSALPDDSRRAAANQARLTERNLAIAREVDRVAESLGATSAQVAVAWVRSRGSSRSSGSARPSSSRTPSAPWSWSCRPHSWPAWTR